MIIELEQYVELKTNIGLNHLKGFIYKRIVNTGSDFKFKAILKSDSHSMDEENAYLVIGRDTILNRGSDFFKIFPRSIGEIIEGTPQLYKLVFNSLSGGYKIGVRLKSDNIAKKTNLKNSCDDLETFSNPLITNDLLNKLFKYIPCRYKSTDGFIYNNKMLFRVSEEQKNGKLLSVIRQRELPENVNYVDYFSVASLLKNCKFILRDYVKSSKLFKYSAEKKSVLNQELEVVKIELQVKLKNKEQLENVITAKINGKELRCSLDDVEIVYPNVNGWTVRKDRKIFIASEVLIKNNKNLRSIPKNTSLVVANIKKVGTKEYAGFNINGKLVYDRINNYKLK